MRQRIEQLRHIQNLTPMISMLETEEHFGDPFCTWVEHQD
jgi:hypothetical protein